MTDNFAPENLCRQTNPYSSIEFDWIVWPICRRCVWASTWVGNLHPPTEKSTDHTHSPSAQIWLSASISTLATTDCSFGGYLISLMFEQSTVSFHYHSILSNLPWDLSLQFCFTPTLNGASNLLLLSSDYRFPIHNIVQQQKWGEANADKFSLSTRSNPLPHFLLGGLPPVAPPFSSVLAFGLGVVWCFQSSLR